MFIELHIIQNFPPSNLNRDDAGQPKDSDFGGFRRARISSQCLKRSIRYAGKDPKDTQGESVFERYTKVPLADRTKMIITELVERLTKKRPDQEVTAKLLATAFAKAYAGGIDSKNAEKTNVLLYLSDQEQRDITEKLNENWDALVAALSPETQLDLIAKQFVEKISSRTNEPAKDDTTIRAKDLGKEIQARLEKNGKDSKNARAIGGEFRKSVQSEAKAFTLKELDWASDEIIKQWDAIQAQRNAESPLKPIVDKLIEETEGRTSAPDIALFGRMLADKPETNIDAACQVAHALSTHTVSRNDLDYFTAVDDLQPKGETGAGFLDVAYFNSACFYRYARIDFDLLKKNLARADDDLPRRTVEAFLRASEAAIPSGKKNSHAQEVRPDLMVAILRSDDSAGWSLVNAFELPVHANQEEGLLATSAHALCDEFDDHCDRYGAKTVVEKSVLVSGRLMRSGAVTGRLANAIAKAESDDKSALDVFVKTICERLPRGA